MGRVDSAEGRNIRFSKTERGHGGESWYVLDNAASFMPALANRTITLVFRISATLGETVRLNELQRALDAVSGRYPYYVVHLRRGFFWYYLAPADGKRPKVVADSKYPCLNMQARRSGRYLFRVRAFKSRIAVEFCHILADGSGALAFLKSLLYEYFRLRGTEIPDPSGILVPGSESEPEEHEDAFNRYFKESVPFAPTEKKAFHFPVLPLLPGQYRVITGVVSLESVLRAAKSYGTSLTEYLAAVYLACLQDMFYALTPAVRRAMRPRIAVQVPVNLRKLFPTKSLRNFSLYVLPSIDTRLGHYDFPEIAKRVHLYMQAEVNAKSIATQISRNVGGGRSYLVRLLPLALKNFAARLVYGRMGEDTMSGFVSNLGRVELPPPLDGLVERFDFIPAPARKYKTNANVVSYGDKLVIAFGSLAVTTDLERLFFTRLSGDGAVARVESNM
jgi:NRPS condensation-like uncharacterized protein